MKEMKNFVRIHKPKLDRETGIEEIIKNIKQTR